MARLAAPLSRSGRSCCRATPGALFDDLAAAGFCAFQVDTYGYEKPAAMLDQTSSNSAPPSRPPRMDDSSPSTFDLAESTRRRAPRFGGGAEKGDQVLDRSICPCDRRLGRDESRRRTRDQAARFPPLAGDSDRYRLDRDHRRSWLLEMAPAEGYDFRPMYQAGWSVLNGLGGLPGRAEFGYPRCPALFLCPCRFDWTSANHACRSSRWW